MDDEFLEEKNFVFVIIVIIRVVIFVVVVILFVECLFCFLFGVYWVILILFFYMFSIVRGFGYVVVIKMIEFLFVWGFFFSKEEISKWWMNEIVL